MKNKIYRSLITLITAAMVSASFTGCHQATTLPASVEVPSEDSSENMSTLPSENSESAAESAESENSSTEEALPETEAQPSAPAFSIKEKEADVYIQYGAYYYALPSAPSDNTNRVGTLEKGTPIHMIGTVDSYEGQPTTWRGKTESWVAFSVTGVTYFVPSEYVADKAPVIKTDPQPNPASQENTNQDSLQIAAQNNTQPTDNKANPSDHTSSNPNPMPSTTNQDNNAGQNNASQSANVPQNDPQDANTSKNSNSQKANTSQSVNASQDNASQNTAPASSQAENKSQGIVPSGDPYDVIVTTQKSVMSDQEKTLYDEALRLVTGETIVMSAEEDKAVTKVFDSKVVLGRKTSLWYSYSDNTPDVHEVACSGTGQDLRSLYSKTIQKFGAIVYPGDEKRTATETCLRIDKIVDYDSNYQSQTFESCLSANRGVCWFYANCYSILLNYEGIPCYNVVGTMDGQPHEWCRAFIGGQWVDMDPTNAVYGMMSNTSYIED